MNSIPIVAKSITVGEFKYLERVDGATVRGDDFFLIGELERLDPI